MPSQAALMDVRVSRVCVWVVRTFVVLFRFVLMSCEGAIALRSCCMPVSCEGALAHRVTDVCACVRGRSHINSDVWLCLCLCLECWGVGRDAAAPQRSGVEGCRRRLSAT
uniref:Uncharacterized protein n=1 Tax=Vitrella brassicaformis TaxID=1169539 RepID=A0A7S1JQH1_9ALVE|mmetsp:Transcript_19889/g.48266  ORF Transcript_19889/g.48266 Transcript_19889/m.48266 type:complete len:110 (+) Transcript_19889:359-688(+)